MTPSAGHVLIILFSTAVLIKETVSESNLQVQKKVKGGSSKSHEDHAVKKNGGRQIRNPMVHRSPQIVIPAAQPEYQPSFPPGIPPGFQPGFVPQVQLPSVAQPAGLQAGMSPGSTLHSRAHGRGKAHGEIRLDLSNLLDEMGINELHQAVHSMSRQVDGIPATLKDVMKDTIDNVLGPTIQLLNSKTDYLTQAVQNVQAGLEAINDDGKAEHQILREFLSSSCQPNNINNGATLQTLENSLLGLMEEVKQIKSSQNTGMKMIAQAILQNNQAMSALQRTVTATFNTCSACSVGPGAQMMALQRTIEAGIGKMANAVASTLQQNLRHSMIEDLTRHANIVIQHSAQQNEGIKQYLYDLANKMMNYRDIFLKNIVQENRRMAMIKKTVTQTTQVLQHAAAGAQAAVRSLATAQRSLDSSSLCGGNQTKGK